VQPRPDRLVVWRWALALSSAHTFADVGKWTRDDADHFTAGDLMMTTVLRITDGKGLLERGHACIGRNNAAPAGFRVAHLLGPPPAAPG
jgi:hypothetical protein